MEHREALDEKLNLLNHVSNWALKEGFDSAELRISWDSWLEELEELEETSGGSFGQPAAQRRDFSVPSRRGTRASSGSLPR